MKIWLIFLLGLLCHPPLKGKGAPKIHRCLWSKRNDNIQRVSKNLQTCISKLYIRHGNREVAPWPLSTNKWWWILNRGRMKFERERTRRKKAMKQTNITSSGSSTDPSDGVSRVLGHLWGYLFIAKLSLPWTYISHLQCKLAIMSSLFFQTFLETGWGSFGGLDLDPPLLQQEQQLHKLKLLSSSLFSLSSCCLLPFPLIAQKSNTFV